MAGHTTVGREQKKEGNGEKSPPLFFRFEKAFPDIVVNDERSTVKQGGEQFENDKFDSEHFECRPLKKRSQHTVLGKTLSEERNSVGGIAGGLEHDPVVVQIYAEQRVDTEEKSSGKKQQYGGEKLFHNLIPFSLAAFKTTVSELAAIAAEHIPGGSAGIPRV